MTKEKRKKHPYGKGARGGPPQRAAVSSSSWGWRCAVPGRANRNTTLTRSSKERGPAMGARGAHTPHLRCALRPPGRPTTKHLTQYVIITLISLIRAGDTHHLSQIALISLLPP